MVVVFPWFTIMIAVLAVLFGFIYMYFRSAVREIKRMDNITRSAFWKLCRIINDFEVMQDHSTGLEFESVFRNLFL